MGGKVMNLQSLQSYEPLQVRKVPPQSKVISFIT